MSHEEIQAMVHELRVHQIELEMQNDELRATQIKLEHARELYVALYDCAPVGYITVSGHGMIVNANLTSVHMLGVERSQLLSLPFSRFAFKDDQEICYLCFRKARDASITQTCEVRLRPVGGDTFHGRLQMVLASGDQDPVCHITLSDITEQKKAEEALREKELRRVQYENEERM